MPVDDVPDPALPWLLGVSRNLLHKQYDAGRRRRVLAERVAEAAIPSMTGPDVAEHVVERESTLAALSALREKDAKAFPQSAKVLGSDDYRIGAGDRAESEPYSSTLDTVSGWTDRIDVPARG